MWPVKEKRGEQMKAFAATDVGKVRQMNQDYFHVSEETNYNLYILADGMGGYTGGEIASKLATECVVEYIKENFDSTGKNKEEILELVRSTMEYANNVVYDKAKHETNLEQMGTTLEICLVYNNRAYIGHIGDSRIYRIRKDIIRRLTTDHSYVQKLLKDGTITKEEAEHHPKKNMLMKALGCEPIIEPDVMVKGFLKDDIILMCSDGLTNMVDEKKIYGLIKNDFDSATQKLIDLANESGGYDNITIITIKN